PDGTVQKGLIVHHSTRNKHINISTNEPFEETVSKLFPTLSFKDNKNNLRHPQHKAPIEDKSDSENEDSMKDSEIVMLVMKYITWLHLDCGLSQEKCRRAQDQVVHILEETLKKNQEKCTFTNSIPREICTTLKKLNLEVAFEQFVCCSNCFSLYDAKLAPEECGYQVSLATQPCGADLFHPHRIVQRDKIDIFKKVLNPKDQGGCLVKFCLVTQHDPGFQNQHLLRRVLQIG
ncbi:hypothetical protein O181_103479, partial [Austropuccinia psidii MF-1]|nr:hypothetical protein [Austropuccinia psidii MF-1]